MYAFTMNVLLADNSVQVRWALRTFVQEQLGWTVVGEAANSEALLAKALAVRPDVILLEWELTGGPGVKIMEALHRQLGSCKIAVLSEYPECQRAALRAGADAFIYKMGPPQQLLRILCELGGNSAHSPCSNGSSRMYQTQS